MSIASHPLDRCERAERTLCGFVRQSWVAPLAIVLFLAGMPTNGWAGCHSGDRSLTTIDAPLVGLARYTTITPLPARCIYENGVVKFFPVVHGSPSSSLPCDGPGCRGKEDDSSIVVVAPDTQRDLQTATIVGHRFSLREPGHRLNARCSFCKPSDFSSGLFRPPRTV